jgi:hypothetical protein
MQWALDQGVQDGMGCAGKCANATEHTARYQVALQHSTAWHAAACWNTQHRQYHLYWLHVLCLVLETRSMLL